LKTAKEFHAEWPSDFADYSHPRMQSLCAARSSFARQVLTALEMREKQVEMLVKALKYFVAEKQCPISDDLAPGFVSGAICGWGAARNYIASALAAVEGKP